MPRKSKETPKLTVKLRRNIYVDGEFQGKGTVMTFDEVLARRLIAVGKAEPFTGEEPKRRRRRNKPAADPVAQVAGSSDDDDTDDE